MNLNLEWCPIPKGQVTLKEPYDPSTYLSKEGQVFSVDGFEILKYPVTVAQFDEFIKDGYMKPEFWHGLPEEFDIPSYLSEFSSYDHPRSNVTWYEAIAFCRWVSKITTQTITLPTEQQWQYAAQGEDGRLYPWGNSWEPNRCNHSVGKNRLEGMITSVKTHENGASPFNVCDMSGNVWEWCISEYNTGKTDLSKERKVIKGGSWAMTEPEDFQVDYRYWLTPDNSVDSCGFRCVKQVKLKTHPK